LALAAVAYWLRNGLTLVLLNLQDELGLSVSTLGVLVSASTAAAAVFAPFAGLAMVRFGTQRIVAFGLAVAAFGGAWTALSADSTGILLSRILIGIGLSVVIPAQCAIFARIPEQRRGLMNGLFEFTSRATGFALAMLSAPVLTLGGWRLFIGLAPVAAAIVAVASLLVRATPVELPDHDPERKQSGRTALACYIAYVAYSFCFLSITSTGGFFLRASSSGSDIYWIVAVLSGIPAAAVLSGLLSDRLIENRGLDSVRVRKWFLVSGLLIAASIAGVGLTRDINLISMLLFFSSFGLAIASPSMWALLQSSARYGRAAVSGGIQGFFGGMVSMFGPVLTLSLAAGEYPSVMFPAALMCVITASVAVPLLRSEPAPAPQRAMKAGTDF
jgi:MFS family permease